MLSELSLSWQCGPLLQLAISSLNMQPQSSSLASGLTRHLHLSTGHLYFRSHKINSYLFAAAADENNLPIIKGWCWASVVAQIVKNLPVNLPCGRPGFDPWVRRIPWRGEWLPTPVFLPGESHGQKSLPGYSPCSHKEAGTTEGLTLSLFTNDASQFQDPCCLCLAGG